MPTKLEQLIREFDKLDHGICGKNRTYEYPRLKAFISTAYQEGVKAGREEVGKELKEWAEKRRESCFDCSIDSTFARCRKSDRNTTLDDLLSKLNSLI